MAVAPSEEQGNVSVETETPDTPAEPETTEETHVETTEATETPADDQPELFELPDGRQVDAATLSKEWKENFYPDYTRKSQALAAKETPQITKPTNPLEDPNYQPQSLAELAAQIEAQTIARLEAKDAERKQSEQAFATAIDNQLAEVRKVDPNVNQDALFLHATKYGFRDLKVAHQNMRDMSEAIKKTQTTTAANIAKRNDPVSVTPGATGSRPNPAQFATAVEYLNAVKASGGK